MGNKELLITLNMIPSLGPKRINNIVQNFANVSEFLNASLLDLSQIIGLNKKTCENILRYRNKIDTAREIKRAEELGINIITIYDKEYPAYLKEIYDPPPVLYVLGDISTFQYDSIAIVGTRKPTNYGKKAAEYFAQELATMEINIVSGMARGIDSSAHMGAVKVGGPTTAVLGCGINIIYPPENVELMKKITKCGCVISSFPLDYKPLPGNFPARNRIISGLSKGIIVVEAAEKSGSLITADFSLEQGREVFAVPGSIFSPYSKGTHFLIKQGAKLVECVDDILEEVSLKTLNSVKMNDTPEENINFSEDERFILKLIDYHPIHMEELLKSSKKSPQELNTILTGLELNGVIDILAGGYVVKI
jgi:DNA processing protein